MKESDALKLWCPFVAIVAPGTAAAVNRLSSRDDDCNCIATRCAVWLGTAADGRCGLTQAK